MLFGYFGSCVINGQVYYRGQILLDPFCPVELAKSVNDLKKEVSQMWCSH
jgi:hypothetical protein